MSNVCPSSKTAKSKFDQEMLQSHPEDQYTAP